MRDRIQDYIEGKFYDSCPEIGLSPAAVEAYAGEGLPFSGNFSLESISGENLKGYVFSEDLRVALPAEKFSGKVWKVPFEISTEGLQRGEVLEGAIGIVTNYGEYQLPYHLTIGEETTQTEEKNVKNLFHFANFAKEAWEEAVTFFSKKEFFDILVNNDRQYRNLYQALTADGPDEQAMDEFLTAVHKKERVSLWLEKTEEYFTSEQLEGEHILSIEKESWGFLNGEIIMEKDSFIRFRKNRITKDDFAGNSCKLPYSFNQSKMHPGLNQETVRIRTPYQELEYRISAEYGKTDPLWDIERSILKYRIEFWNLYIIFRKKEITSGFWVEQSLELVENILKLDSENKEWKLMKAQLLLLGKRETEGKLLLDTFEKGKNLKENSRVLYGYYLYLSACYKKDRKQIKKTVEELWKIYQENEKAFPVLWMLFYLDEELENNLTKKWNLLREQHKMGCSSPLLYTEALLLLKKDEELLQKLGKFEVQLLLFAYKQNLFRHKWLDRILALSMKNIQFHPLLFRLYRICYHLAPGKEWLTVIVSLLVRSGETRREYLEWYEMAVAQNLNIAGIFEKFMEHLKYRQEKKLPRSVMEYYAPSVQGLRREQKTELFHLIQKFGCSGTRKKNQLTARYEKMIHSFLEEQILEGNIDTELAELYNEYLDGNLLSEEIILEKCGEMLFLEQITSPWKQIGKVLVVHEKMAKTEEYPWENNRAVVPIYSEKDCIVLVDEQGRRYAKSGDCIRNRLLDSRKFAGYFDEDSALPHGLIMNREIEGQRYLNISPENLYYLELLVKDSRMTKEFRVELTMALLKYYQSSFQSKKLRNALKEVRMEDYTAVERDRILEMLLGEGMYEEAYPAVCTYGFSYIDSRILVGMLNDRIVEVDFAEEENLVKLCLQVVKSGKYTENMLEYLSRYYDGELASLKEIWNIVHGFGMDSTMLAERILNRIVFVGGSTTDYHEVFQDYAGEKGYDRLVCACLSLESYYYFVKEKKGCAAIADSLGELLEKGQNLPWVCKLAFMKYCSLQQEAGEKEKRLLNRLMGEALEKRQVYPFFQNLERLLDKDYGFENQVIIEYRAKPESKVWLHYLLETDGSGEEKYSTECMEENFEGIFTRSFTLFYGEKLQYYITEGTADNRYFKESRTLCGGKENFFKRERRLQLLNDILVCAKQENETELFQRMDKYVSMDYLAGALFKRL